jgi:hypothetical protein
MKDPKNSLTTFGFCPVRREAECWRVARISAPIPSVPARSRREPANSRALPRWLDRLADCDRPSPYRITPVTPITTSILGVGRRRALR